MPSGKESKSHVCPSFQEAPPHMVRLFPRPLSAYSYLKVRNCKMNNPNVK